MFPYKTFPAQNVILQNVSNNKFLTLKNVKMQFFKWNFFHQETFGGRKRFVEENIL